jgi:hypothetical protein
MITVAPDSGEMPTVAEPNPTPPTDWHAEGATLTDLVHGSMSNSPEAGPAMAKPLAAEAVQL